MIDEMRQELRERYEKLKGNELPTQEEIYKCLTLWREHKEFLAKGEPERLAALSLRLQRILEACYPEDADKQQDLFCALVDIGSGFIPLSKIFRAFSKWDVKEALGCDELREIFGTLEVVRG